MKKEQLPLIADILQADKKELETLWLADQLMQLVQDEPTANEAWELVSKQLRTANEHQHSKIKK